MDLTIIYTKTGRGTRALIKKLPHVAGQILSVMGTNVSAEDILSKLKKVNERDFELAITWLLEGGFIKTVVKEAFSNSIWAIPSQGAIEVSEISFDEFNLMKTTSDDNKPPDSNLVVLSEARAKAEAEAKAKIATTPATRTDPREKFDALAKADAEARERAEAQAKAEADTRAKAEVKAKEEVEAKARADAAAKEKAETEAKAKADALAKADAEARERAEAQAKAEADTRAKAEVKAKEEVEAKARADAAAKEKAETEAKAKADALAKADAEARERAEAQAKAEADTRAKAEVKAKEEVEAKARAEAAAKEKAETEAKAKAEEKARTETEAAAKVAAKEEAKALAKAAAEAEAEAKAAAKAEAKALARAEVLAKAESQEKARAEAEALAKAEAEAEKRAVEEAKALAEVLAKAEAIAKEKAEAAAKAKAKALAKAEEKTKKKAVTKAKIEKFKSGATLKIQKLNNTSAKKFQNLRSRIGSIKIKKASKQWLPYFFTIIKAIFIYSVVLLVLLVIAAQFINMRMLIKPIENTVFENIQEPVKIEAVYASMFPTPHLMLKNVSVGNSNSTTANIQTVRIFPVLSSLKENMGTASTVPYEIKSIEIEDLNLSQNNLSRPMSWVKATSKLNRLKIKEIILRNTLIHLNGMEFPAINGDIQLNPIGQFDNAVLRTEDKSLTIEIKDANSNYQINIKALKWRSPMPPNLVFAELDANGTWENNTLTLSPIRGILYEGNLTANMVVDLTGAWATKGDFEINGVNLTDMALELKLNSAIDGTLNTNANFSFDFDKSSNQIEAPTINAHFKINNGFIRKIDLTEAMRTNNLGGSTHFTEFSGDLLLSDQNYQFRNLSLQDNQLQASGTFNISPQKTVAGDIYSKIMLKSNTIKSRLIITGTTNNLVLKK